MSASHEPCRYWIGNDTTGRVCSAPVGDGPLPYCPKHLEVERARTIRRLAKERAAAERAETVWRARHVPKLPAMRVQLERAIAEYARRTGSVVEDRAAYGGAMHPSVHRAQQAQLSDSNVARVVELERIILRLNDTITRAEREPTDPPTP